MLITSSDFPNQIYTWLMSIGFDCKYDQKPAENFPVIEVWQNDLFKLEIKLVILQFWKEDNASEELKIYAARQDQLRARQIASIILWEDFWISKKNIVKSRLHSILGISVRIPGRLTYAARIDKLTAAEFLSENHLQGSVLSKYRFGLYLPVRYFRVLPTDYQIKTTDKDLLVATATFSYPRIFSQDEKPFRSIELIRFANLINTTVVGGMDKLLSIFIKEIRPDDIMTYIDLEWSDGASYRRLGFREISRKPPIGFFVNVKTFDRFSSRNVAEGDPVIKICNAGSLKFVKVVEQK